MKKNTLFYNLSIKDALYYIIIIFVIITGILYRTKIWLMEPSLFGDEGSLIINIKEKSYLQLFGSLNLAQSCPPILLIFMKLIYSIFGLNETALRFPAYISGIISIILIPFLSNKIFKFKYIGLIFLSIFIFNDNLCFYSQEVKQYSTDVFTTILCLLLFLSFKDKVTDKKSAIITGMLFGLVCYLSLPSQFIVFPMFIYFAYNFIKEKDKKAIYLSIPYILLLLIYFFTNVLGTMNNGILDCWTNETHIFESFNNCIEVFRYINIVNFNNIYIYIYIYIYCCGLLYLLFKEKLLFFILVSPIILNAISGYLLLYPFTKSRVTLYLFPIIFIIFLKPLEILNLTKITNNKILTALSYITILILGVYMSFNMWDNKRSPNINIGNQKYFYYMSNSKEYIQKLNTLTIQPDDIIFVDRTGEGIFVLYDKEFKYETSNVMYQSDGPIQTSDHREGHDAKSLNELPINSKIYFYNSKLYIDFNDYEEVNKWIDENTEVLFKEEDASGVFLYVKKIK